MFLLHVQVWLPLVSIARDLKKGCYSAINGTSHEVDVVVGFVKIFVSLFFVVVSCISWWCVEVLGAYCNFVVHKCGLFGKFCGVVCNFVIVMWLVFQF